MKKLLGLLLVLAVAAPSFAAVTIECNDLGNGVVAIQYSGADDANKPRALALVVSVDNGAKIIDVIGFPDDGSGYGIYPGTISISGGAVQQYNTPVAPNTDPGASGTGFGTDTVVLEMGALHFPADYGSPNAPADSGTLAQIVVDGDCNVTIAEEDTFRGGIVLYDGTDAGATLSGCAVSTTPLECMKSTHPAYAAWDAAGKPDCWCYEYNCRGDADGCKQFGMRVLSDDLGILAYAYGQALPPGDPGHCADFDRLAQFGFRVLSDDLMILAGGYGRPVTPCDATHINYWIVPDCNIIQ